MNSIIEQLIADFQEFELPELTRRNIRVPWLDNKIDTVIGMRRTGKTWFLFQLISDLLSKGHPAESILYINFEDERLLPMRVSDLHLVTDAFYRRYPLMRDRKCFLFFDEIHNIQGWEKYIRRIFDTEDIHICLTGSSAKLLSLEIATSLRGRSIATELFPFSFSEYLTHQNITLDKNKRPGKKMRALLENRLQRYLIEGGFPEVQNIGPEYRIRILQEYLNVVLLRDVAERNQISNITPLRYLSRHLLHSNASLFSMNKFYHSLKSQGISCSKNSLHNYLAYLSDVYLFFDVTIYTYSERQRMVNPKKVYAVDTGLVQACSQSVHPDWGLLLENFVYLELRKTGSQINYYKTKKGHEVDFVTTDIHGRLTLYQVALDLNDPETRKREIRSLDTAMQELSLKVSFIITLNHEEDIQKDAKRIHVIPAWYWALYKRDGGKP